MKKSLALAAALVVSSAQAAEIKFGDLNYFLKQGQKNVSANVAVQNETTRLDGGTVDEVDGYFINANFGYAFSDELNAFVGLDYLYDVKTDNDGSTYDTTGLQNPKLGANYRLIKQANQGFNFDVGAVASFKIMDRNLGDSNPDKEGDLLSPTYSNLTESRDTLDLNARLGKKFDEANEFYFIAGIAYHMDGEYYSHAIKEDVNLDSSMDIKAAAFYQYRPVNEFMMTLGLSGVRYGDVDGDTSGIDFTYKNHTDFKFSFDAKYLINDGFIAKFSFTKDRRGDYDLENDLGDSKVDKRNAVSYGLGIDYLF